MKLTMIGAEWFDSRPGGLNRYFQSLAQAMMSVDAVEATAWAFGDAPSWGRSLGPTGLGLRDRVRARPEGIADADVIDRHFALYGGATGKSRPDAVRVFHFQGPWAGESQVAKNSRMNVAVKRLVERHAYGSIDAFITLSAPFRDLLVEQYGADADRVTVIPPGVDPAAFRAREGASRAAKPRVLCVRRLERRMGIHVLLRAWRDVVAIQPDAELRIVGTGSYERELHQLAASLRLEKSVTFLGRIDDASLAEEYGSATSSVVPTLALEGFGLIALESLAAGTPVVVTRCGGLPDAVEGLDPTLIVAVDDVTALAARLVKALEGEVPSEVACIQHAETFGWTRVAERHADLYRSLITASRR